MQYSGDKRLKIVSQRRGIYNFFLPPYLINLCELNPVIHAKKHPFVGLEVGSWGYDKLEETPKNAKLH